MPVRVGATIPLASAIRRHRRKRKPGFHARLPSPTLLYMRDCGANRLIRSFIRMFGRQFQNTRHAAPLQSSCLHYAADISTIRKLAVRQSRTFVASVYYPPRADVPGIRRTGRDAGFALMPRDVGRSVRLAPDPNQQPERRAEKPHCSRNRNRRDI